MTAMTEISSGVGLTAGWRSRNFRSVSAINLATGESGACLSTVAEEVPIAIRYNGFAHAVMMATPDDLTDFVAGFSLTEGVIRRLDELGPISIVPADDGIAADIALTPAAFTRYLARRRVRSLRGHPGCGVCGVADLDDLHRPITRVPPSPVPDGAEIESALEALRLHQPLSRETRGAHAAAWIVPGGRIQTVREDVGRHNALDKLIGAGLRGAFSCERGFCLITSRCSFEMVQKAVSANFGVLVSISAPTALAIRTAREAGLTLLALDRARRQFLYTQTLQETVS
jgi:FdhD protein